jgi:SAM-dependent methyltransferase
MAARRRKLLAGARGAVLEIGAGTGLNLPHCPTDLDRLVRTEPGARIGHHINLDRASEGVPTELVRAPAEQLPFEDDSFDTVVSTLVLCTVTDPERAVAEIARVLRPWAAFADGCQCDRPTLQTIEATMEVRSVDRGRWRGMPAIIKPLVWGVAAS